MKASDISDEQLTAALVRVTNPATKWASLWAVQDTLSEFPPKVVQAKLRSAIKRKVIDGCACGCRGDFTIVVDESH